MVKYAAKFRFSSQLFITSVLLLLLTTLPKTNSYKPIKCDDACLAKTTFTSKNGYEKTKALLQQGHNGTKWFHGDFKYYKKGQLNGNYSSYMHKKEIDELNYYLRIHAGLELLPIFMYERVGPYGDPYMISDFEPSSTEEFSGEVRFFKKLIEIRIKKFIL